MNEVESNKLDVAFSCKPKGRSAWGQAEPSHSSPEPCCKDAWSRFLVIWRQAESSWNLPHAT